MTRLQEARLRTVIFNLNECNDNILFMRFCKVVSLSAWRQARESQKYYLNELAKIKLELQKDKK